MTARVLLLGALVLGTALAAGPADARERRQPREDRGGETVQQGWRDGREDTDAPRGRGDPAAAAREALARNGGGRVLSVEPEGSGYRVKVLKNGEVRTHHVE